ncbi:MAG: phosphonate utilization protein [Betaproteobacteria bacterium]|nr:phosphonate utilization protein [Betaproteobacteria bacterium]
MSGFLFLSVLVAAMMHATWNTLMKSAPDKNLETALANFSTSLVAIPFLLIYGLPEPETYIYILLSLVLHVIYFYTVASAYRYGDLNMAYPIMRGVAPILTLIIGGILFEEAIHAWMVVGIVLICVGVVFLGFNKSPSTVHHQKTLLFALGNAVIIAAYTLVDGQGARLANQVWSYVGMLLFLNGYVFPAILFWQRKNSFTRTQTLQYIQARGIHALIGGSCVMGSYSIVLWAMTQAPIATVAAVRETSVLFAFMFAVVFLKEPLYPLRIVGMLGVCCGVVLIRFT